MERRKPTRFDFKSLTEVRLLSRTRTATAEESWA